MLLCPGVSLAGAGQAGDADTSVSPGADLAPSQPVIDTLDAGDAADEAVARIRSEAPALAAGIVVLALGLAGVALFGAHRRPRDLALLYFAIFTSLYGLRLLTYTYTTSRLLALEPGVLARIEAAITYVINLPLALFLERFIGPGWRKVITRLRQAWTVLAMIGVASASVADDPYVLMGVNNVLVILGLLVTIAHYRDIERAASPTGSWAIGLGLVVLGTFVLNNNLSGLGLLPWGEGSEEIGFLVFIACLGYLLARRQVEAGRQLIAIEQELRTARSIQESILPRTLPRLDGLELAARYVPMAAIGGDFYEFLSVDRHRVGVLLADVSGHGVPAALIASMVKIAISSQAEHADSPGRVLAGMNDILCGKLERQFVTATYVFFDLDAGRMVWANAGHPPALLWRAGEGRVIELSAPGLMMGFQPAAEYGERDCAIANHDRIVLYTDGIIEATNRAGDFFDPEGLRAFVTARGGLSAEAFGSALLDHLSVWSGRSSGDGSGDGFEDDLTLVSARVSTLDARP